jgi:hypothetical protein
VLAGQRRGAIHELYPSPRQTDEKFEILIAVDGERLIESADLKQDFPTDREVAAVEIPEPEPVARPGQILKMAVESHADVPNDRWG